MCQSGNRKNKKTTRLIVLKMSIEKKKLLINFIYYLMFDKNINIHLFYY